MLVDDFKEYLELEKQYSNHTVKAYVDDLNHFQNFVKEEFSESDLKKAHYVMIRSWIVKLVNDGLENRSVNRKISSLQSFYSFLLKTDQLKISPLLKHHSLKTKKEVQLPFSRKEMEAFFQLHFPDDFEGVRNRFLIALFYAAGLRRSELISIRLNDWDKSAQQIKIHGKGNKERIVPVLPELGEMLALYMKYREELPNIVDQEFLFLTKKGRKMYDRLVYRVVVETFQDLSTKKKVSPHILRHSFATHLLNEGAGINDIKNLLGHASLASTQVYVHNDIDSLKKVYHQAHPRDQKKNN